MLYLAPKSNYFKIVNLSISNIKINNWSTCQACGNVMFRIFNESLVVLLTFLRENRVTCENRNTRATQKKCLLKKKQKTNHRKNKTFLHALVGLGYSYRRA